MGEKFTAGSCKAGSFKKKHEGTVKRTPYRKREVFLESN